MKDARTKSWGHRWKALRRRRRGGNNDDCQTCQWNPEPAQEAAHGMSPEMIKKDLPSEETV
jgi:hypothetical protein